MQQPAPGNEQRTPPRRASFTDESAAVAAARVTGEMAARIDAFDWTSTSMGPRDRWPVSLRTIVKTMLAAPFPHFLWWGPELLYLYNDAYIEVLGANHPAALGAPVRTVWGELLPTIQPQIDFVMSEGQATWNEDRLLYMQRHGFTEEVYFSWSYSPLFDDSGRVSGVLGLCVDETARIVDRRRLDLLRSLSLGEGAESLQSMGAAAAFVLKTLGTAPSDLLFVAHYEIDQRHGHARRIGLTEMPPESAEHFPVLIPLPGLSPDSPAMLQPQSPYGAGEFLSAPRNRDDAWGMGEMLSRRQPLLISELQSIFSGLISGPENEAICRALVLPLSSTAAGLIDGCLIVGISPVQRWDNRYAEFVRIVSHHVRAVLTAARAVEDERQRAETLAALDRAKSAFFANISHEFRTPLTLILSPLDEALRHKEALPENDREPLDIAWRNALRLQGLVDTLLEFSRVEAGRRQPQWEAVDLSRLTSELASNFVSLCRRANLELVIDCPPLPSPILMDREMWERIVLNLVSNAFKFTLRGEIQVSLQLAGRNLELRVTDTGIGIAAGELPHLFERFHRVEATEGRTFEGTGIGLALTSELIELLDGTIEVTSEPGRGSTFVVSIPYREASGRDAGLPDSPGLKDDASFPKATVPRTQVLEAERWLAEHPFASQDELAAREAASSLVALVGVDPATHTTSEAQRPRIVLADDNADMRSYLRRLLLADYDVITVENGQAAIDAVKRLQPDLLLSDVMMPGKSGIEILRELRQTTETREQRIIMMSARSDASARIEALEAGADDYLSKPFNTRELQASIRSNIQLQSMRRQAAGAIEESERRFREMADFAPVKIWVTNQAGECTYFNRRWQRFTGEPRTNGPRLCWLDRIHPEDREAAIATFENAERLAEPYQTEYRLRSATNEFRWVIVAAVPRLNEQQQFLGFIGSTLDITDRRRAEADLRDARSRLDAALTAGEIGTWNWHIPEDRVVADRNLARMFGVSAEDALGGPLSRYLPAVYEEDRDRVARAIGEAVATGGAFDTDYRIKSPSGEIRWVVARGQVVLDKAGKPLELPGAIVDITDRKHAEEALREADRRKDHFLATLAHELRNPIAPISNALSIWRTVEDDPLAREQLLQMMERQIGQMRRLIDDLLDVSRITRGVIQLRKQVVSVATIIESAVETVRPMIESHQHELTVSLPSELLMVDGDIARLMQVVSNLLVNAAKYTQAGGTIGISTRREGSSVIIRVTDNGLGIDPQVIPKVFEPFMQVDSSLHRSQGGLGIGLTLARTLIDLHGGTLEACSEGLGKGSTFTATLPALAALTQTADELASEPSLVPKEHLPTLRVLVVDDVAASAKTLGMMLNALGQKVDLAFDGWTAIERARQEPPDVIFLDIAMPGMDGYTVARRLRSDPALRGVTLVALTGFGQEEDRQRALTAGFDHHLTKPTSLDHLRDVLATIHPANSRKA